MAQTGGAGVSTARNHRVRRSRSIRRKCGHADSEQRSKRQPWIVPRRKTQICDSNRLVTLVRLKQATQPAV